MMDIVRPLRAGVVALAGLTLAAGVIYPAVMLGIGQAVAGEQANGSLLRGADGGIVGSRLLGQAYVGPDGQALPQYLQGRPSAAGEDGYDGASSGASNYGTENPEQVAAVKERRAEIARREGVDPAQVPADAVTASSSGLDPHISPAYARLQVARIARERGLPSAQVQRILDEHTIRRPAGLVGEEGVNVLEANLALDEASAG